VMDWESRSIPTPDLYVAAATPAARDSAVRLAEKLRRADLSVETDLEDRSLKAQLRSAGRIGAARVIILGDDEIISGTLQVKDFETGIQETVSEGEFLAALFGGSPPTKGDD
jgi:histidyl-tRNA synthetase